MKKIMIAIVAFCSACVAAQNGVVTNGTAWLDDLDSSSRVVVDAFENSSNRVDALIQERATKNYDALTNKPSINGVELTGDFNIPVMTTNDVKGIVTNSTAAGVYPFSSDVYIVQQALNAYVDKIKWVYQRDGSWEQYRLENLPDIDGFDQGSIALNYVDGVVENDWAGRIEGGKAIFYQAYISQGRGYPEDNDTLVTITVDLNKLVNGSGVASGNRLGLATREDVYKSSFGLSVTNNSVFIGNSADDGVPNYSVMVGNSSLVYDNSVAIGNSTYANNGIAIGHYASARNSIQIGGINIYDEDSLPLDVYFYEYKLLNSDGTIPAERVTELHNGTESRTADSLFRSADNVNTLWSYIYGENVWIAVTNYMRTVGGVAPSFQLWEKRDGQTNLVYWSAEEIDIRVGDKITVAMSNIVDSVVTAKADRAWSKYQSMTGADNPQPNDVTIVSTPSVMLSGGYEWQRFVDTGAEVWVLKCNDLITLGADTNAYFRITDLEGETQFAIEKTASRLVDAIPTATGFTTDGNNYFRVTFSGNIQPTIYVSPELVSSFFLECNATENEHGLSCTWEHDAAANTYTATIAHNAGDGKPSRMFVYGKVLQEGSTVVKHTAPSSFDGGIIINGIQYSVGTATIDGNTVMTLNPVTRAVNE